MNWKGVKALVGLATVAVIFFACVSFGYGVGSEGLDPSWSQVLGYAWQHKLQWGTDIVFTYGPYGAMAPGAAFHPAFFYTFVLVQVSMTLSIAVASTYLLLAWRYVGSVLLVLLLCATHAERGDWSLYLLFALTYAALHRYTATSSPGAAAFACASAVAVTCLVSLTKFSFAPLWIVWLGCLSLTFLQRRNFRLCGVLWISAAISFVSLWVAADQHITNIFAYLHSSLELVRGFAGAMSSPADLSTLRLGGTLLCLLIGVLAWRLLKRRRGEQNELPLFLFYFAFLLLGWKAGFTRADSHVSSFYLIAAVTAIVMMQHAWHGMTSNAAWLGRGAMGMTALVAIAAMYPYSPGAPTILWRAPVATMLDAKLALQQFANLDEFRRSRIAQRDAAAGIAALPRIRAQVANAPVDLYTANQAAVILNNLNYQPRPIFQSYATYSPWLAELNRQAATDPRRAPAYLLVQLLVIDGHLPTLEDASAMTQVLRGYDALLVEKDVLLMARRTPYPTAAEFKSIGSRAMRFSEAIELPCASQMLCKLHVDVKLTALGKLYSAIMGEPALEIEITEKSGRVGTFRLVRGMAGGFLLSPFYVSTADFALVAAGIDPHPVRSFSVRPQSPRFRFAFVPGATVEFTAADWPHRSTTLASDVVSWMYPGFRSRPVVSTGDVRAVDFDGRRVLLAHAPSVLEFDVDATNQRISFDFGIANDAWGSPEKCPGTDGVEFAVQVGTGAEPLFTRYLDPAKVESDRGPQHVEIPIPADAGKTLRILTSAGKSGDVSCDWAWLSNVSLSQ